MISTVDSVFARIRNSLDEAGIADNTVIIFMGDNGYFLGEKAMPANGFCMNNLSGFQ